MNIFCKMNRVSGFTIVLLVWAAFLSGTAKAQDLSLVTALQTPVPQKKPVSQKLTAEQYLTRGNKAYQDKDYAAAAKYYRQASDAKKGSNKTKASAEHRLGDLYKNGLGVEEDYQLAVNWYQKAANHGDKKALEDKPQPKEFVSQEGKFSILIPGTVKSDSQTIVLQNSLGSTTLYSYFVEAQNKYVAYMVMYNDYPSSVDVSSPETVLTRARDGALKGGKATLISDKPVTLGGIPGRVFTCQGAEGYFFEVHHYFIGHRLYQVMIVVFKGYDAMYKDSFFDSFKILP